MNNFKHLSLILMVSCVFFVSAGHAQTCYDSHNLMTATNKDFIKHGEGVVTHLPTGLMWKQCLEGVSGATCTEGSKLDLSWGDALNQVKAVNDADVGFAGYRDWRLPSPKEVMSIMEFGCHRPAINLAVFPNMPAVRIWLSTASEKVGNLKSWFANYGEAEVNGDSGTVSDLNANRESQLYSVHLVRGAQ